MRTRLSRSENEAPALRNFPASVSGSPLHSATASIDIPTLQRKASCSCGGGCPTCQKKGDLKVSHPHDPAEIEADAVADRVMRMPDDRALGEKGGATVSSSGLSASIQRKPLSSATSSRSQHPGHVQRALSSGGRPLDVQTRNFFEPRFGHDLSSVRVHTGSQAADSAREVDAKAYAIGTDIVFGAGHFAPDTTEGQKLLAHELTHVWQQRGGSSSGPGSHVIARQPATDRPSIPKPKDTVAVSRVENEDGTWSSLNSKGEVIETGLLGPVINPSLPNLYQTTVVGERIKGDSQTKPAASSSCPAQYTEVSIGDDDTTTPIPRRAEYVDNAMEEMLYGLYLGGFELHMKGGDKVFVSNRYLVDRDDSRSVGDCIYNTVDEANAGVVSETRAGDTVPRHAYYWGAGGKYIVPNVFSNATTPRIMATLYAARTDLANQVQRDLIGVATGMIISKGLSIGYSKAKTSFTSDPLPPKNVAPPIQKTPPPPPDLKVIQGGKGTGSAPTVNAPAVNTGAPTSGANYTPYYGPGGAAPMMSANPAPASTPVPRPGPVGVPGWNPNPVPAISPVPVPSWRSNPVSVAPPPTGFGDPSASAFKFGASVLGWSPVPRPDVDRDHDKETKRGKCKYISIGQQFGRYLCHAQYATSLSQVPREMRITDPNGISVDYDAMDWGGSLYEVKTGYRWLVFMGDPVRVNDIAARFWMQAVEQLMVAEECGHSLTWYFNDPYVASFFGAENSPYPEYFQAPLPVRVRYEPFNCDVDSDG